MAPPSRTRSYRDSGRVSAAAVLAMCRTSGVTPAFSATEVLKNLREMRPEYSAFFYKEATLNPTNPRDRAADWEADIVQKFRNDSGTHEIVGERATPMGDSLYLARPIRAE